MCLAEGLLTSVPVVRGSHCERNQGFKGNLRCPVCVWTLYMSCIFVYRIRHDSNSMQNCMIYVKVQDDFVKINLKR